MKSACYPLHLPAPLAREVEATVRATGLTKADTMRQALKLGLPRLRKMRGPNPKRKLFDLAPWNSGELAAAYRDKAVDEDYPIGSMIRHQAFPKD